MAFTGTKFFTGVDPPTHAEIRATADVRMTPSYLVASWLAEFGYPRGDRNGILQAVAERGIVRVARELELHGKRVAERRTEGFNRTYERNAAARGQYERD